jgi:hypothetical protein
MVCSNVMDFKLSRVKFFSEKILLMGLGKCMSKAQEGKISIIG